MPRDEWVAGDGATPAMTHATHVRQAWERFVGEGRLETVRTPIADSSHAGGVDPSRQRIAPLPADAEEASARRPAHPLAVAAALIHDCLGPAATAAGGLIVVRDEQGTILWIDGPDGVRLDAAEHFDEVVQQCTCSAAPVHDPETGRLLGVIDITGTLESVDPFCLGCAVAAARAVEYHLRWLMNERDGRLWARHEQQVPPGGGELAFPSGLRAVADRVGGEAAFVVRAVDGQSAPVVRPRLMLRLLRREKARVELDGLPLPLSPTQIEMLALLAARPGGMTSEELAADLYGDDGRPSTVRVQIFRLRKMLGPWIETTPYRLSIDVDSDVAHVTRLLERGAVREAAQCYDAPLLARSAAPGVVRERDALETWLRQAVMTSNDPATLWAWARSASGCDDLAAWKRLLANLDYNDPRRSRAASRVHALRAAYALEAPSTATDVVRRASA
jgi:hypothetical protein